MKVLIIDDEEAQFFLIKSMLEDAEIYYERDGLNCEAHDDIYDYIVIDINLASESGYEIYSKMKPRHSAVFLIASSLVDGATYPVSEGDFVIGKDKLKKFFQRQGMSGGRSNK